MGNGENSILKSIKQDILVFIDDQEIRDIICFFLERNSFHVIHSKSINETIEIVKQNKIEALVIDLNLSVEKGLSLLADIKKININLPVIFIANAIADTHIQEIYDKGCDAIFTKPLEPKILVEAIKKIISEKDNPWKRPRFFRAHTLFQVNVKFTGMAVAELKEGINIGRGGFFVKMSDNFPKVNELIHFKIALDVIGVMVIEGEGIVRWIRFQQEGDLPPGCGIEFTNLDDKSKAKVFEVINHFKMVQYIPKR